MAYAVTLLVNSSLGVVYGRLTDPASWEATLNARDEALAKMKEGELGYIQLVEGGNVHIVTPAVANASTLTFAIEEA